MGDKVSNLTLSDLVLGKRSVDPYLNTARAVLGQGVGMGWGEEAEAWLRSKLGNESYETALPRIREEYGQYAKQYPITQGVSEFVGGAAPGIGMMFVPGMQPAGLMRLGALGAATGAVSGAGSATEGDRVSGAGGGALIGGGLGVSLPIALRAAGGAGKWLRERLFSTPQVVQDRALEKMTEAMRQAKVTPREVQVKMAQDRAMGVPSVMANANPALRDLAEAVAQRAGAGSNAIENALTTQRLGARDRVKAQTTAALKPADYYGLEDNLTAQLRNNAKSLYEKAYAYGDVDDPRIVEVLKNPQFKAFFDKARGIADTEAQTAKLKGEDPLKFALPEIYKPSGRFDASGAEILDLVKLPDVRTLDYIKRGIDATIDSGFRGKGMSTAEASALRDLRKQFVNAIDENVPDYKFARKTYAGDLETLDALRMGREEFKDLDPEQVKKMVDAMSSGEKDAFRTGVARYFYGIIGKQSNEPNMAQRIIGPEDMQKKLAMLFDNPAEFDLYKTALMRESQLYKESNKILGGAQTAKRLDLKESLDDDTGMIESAAKAATGNFSGALSGMVMGAIRSTQMSKARAEKLSEMLMAKEPNEVAAAVQMIENYATKQAPKQFRATLGEAGTVTGTSAAINPAPAPTAFDIMSPTDDIERVLQDRDATSIEESDIEKALKNRDKVK
jgi:hypothetical protein